MTIASGFKGWHEDYGKTLCKDHPEHRLGDAAAQYNAITEALEKLRSEPILRNIDLNKSDIYEFTEAASERAITYRNTLRQPGKTFSFRHMKLPGAADSICIFDADSLCLVRSLEKARPAKEVLDSIRGDKDAQRSARLGWRAEVIDMAVRKIEDLLLFQVTRSTVWHGSFVAEDRTAAWNLESVVHRSYASKGGRYKLAPQFNRTYSTRTQLDDDFSASLSTDTLSSCDTTEAYIAYLNFPTRLVVAAEPSNPTPPRVVGKGSTQRSLHEPFDNRRVHRVLCPEEAELLYPLEERTPHQGGTHASPISHKRVAHKRVLRHPRFKNSVGKVIEVKETWVGPTEWEDQYIHYRVVPPKGQST